MHIFNILESEYKQNLKADLLKKNLYGEVFTPFSLINQMLDSMDECIFKNPNHTFLDIGAGSGYFSMCLFWKLNKLLEIEIPDKQKRGRHIIEKMLFMIDIQRENIDKLKILFGNKANIIFGNFLEYNKLEFDFIIGNPPYNSEQLKKVPTNNILKKINDGHTIWPDFVRQSLKLLKNKGEIMVIIPAIWMKPDKAKMYDFITKYKIKKLRCFSNTETNKIFNKNAQTPTSVIYLKKIPNDFKVLIYDKDMKTYIDYVYYKNEPLPVFGASILSKIKTTNNIKNIIKTNCPPKKMNFSPVQSIQFPYKNIKTCKLNKVNPELIYEYSDKQLDYSDTKKIILAHKMYGFPFFDKEGKYGISKRDNYLILSDNDKELSNYKDFFSTNTALYLFECTRYRMKYLEKYIFELLPDINKLDNFPSIINDESIAEYYNFNDMEIEAINNLHKKNYSFKFCE